MRPTMHVCLASGAAAVALCSAGFAGDAATASNQELLDRLKAAEARINELEAQNTDNWLTEQRAEEIKGLVQDVLADADTRASLLQSGMTAGYDNGAVISSSDGNWLLRANLLLQTRFVWGHQDRGNGNPDPNLDPDVWGFGVPRAKFILSGHVVNPQFFYRVDINVGNAEGQANRTGLLNAYVGYDYGNGFKVSVGQMKVPLIREDMVESQYQQFVERSVWAYQFTGGYTDGLCVEYSTDMWRAWGVYSDGANAVNTPSNVQTTEYALTGRGEFKFAGTWDQFDDLTSPPGTEMGILVGGGVHYQDGAYGATLPTATQPAPATTQTEVLLATVDCQAEFSGWNLFGAFAYANLRPPGGIAGTPASNVFGFMVQGGFYIAEDWELFARYEWTNYDTNNVEDLSIITGGVNKYFAGHNAKATLDFGYALNAIDFTSAVSGLVPGGVPAPITDWRTDNIGEDGQWLLRTQFQIFF